MCAVPRPFKQTEMSRKALLTSSFPYASRPLGFHQVVDALQADIHARFLRLVGREVRFICAADCHGTEVQRSAAEEGVEPEALADRYSDEHRRDFGSLHIEFSDFASTHCSANRELSVFVFNRLREKGYLYEREVLLGFCGTCRRFLPVRFDRGRCPGCGIGVDVPGPCRVCGAFGRLADPVVPGCPDCGGETVSRPSRHYFFRLSEFSGRLAAWVRSAGGLQPGVEQRVVEHLKDGLDDWCISRDGPYFGFPIPGELKKFLCVWLDAPLGYLTGSGEQWHQGLSEIIQFVRRDTLAFHTLFWPAVLMGADFGLPNRIVTQQFVVRPDPPVRELVQQVDPECLRYAVASRLGRGPDEIELGPDVFSDAAAGEPGGRILHFIRRALEGPGAASPDSGALLARYAAVGDAYADLDPRSAMIRALELLDGVADPGPALCRDLVILLKPVLPRLGRQVEALLGAERPWSWDDLGAPFSGQVGGTLDTLADRFTGPGR